MEKTQLFLCVCACTLHLITNVCVNAFSTRSGTIHVHYFIVCINIYFRNIKALQSLCKKERTFLQTVPKVECKNHNKNLFNVNNLNRKKEINST